MTDLNSKPHSITHIQNMSYDEEKQLAVREIVGVDPNGVVRKVPVGTDGSLATYGNPQFNTNHIDDTTTTNVVYIGSEDRDGVSYIKKIDSTGSFPVFTYASITNNPTLTAYATLWAARTTATYGTYSEAF